MKLLDGSLGGASPTTSNYGAKFGESVANLGIVTSNIAGVKVSTTVGASGKGGENAVWDATGMELTINLVEGQTYTQSQIDELVNQANVEKAATGSPASVKVQLENGIVKVDSAALATGNGTVAGLRGTSAATSLADLQGDSPAATINYSDKITFVRNSYGTNASTDTVGTIGIATDVAAGKETASLAADGTLTLHLATGVDYTEKDIESIMKKEGFDYEVQLTSTVNPNGDANGVTRFNVVDAGTTVTATITDGAGVGKENLAAAGEGLVFQIGANGVKDQRVTLNVDDMGAASLGIANIDVSTREAANKAIEAVDAATKKVSLQRADLGALQNRLEYTVNNLTTTNENLTNAESQIRDTDMATEMINYTKFNILQQASQAMLAQANQQPQAVLQLLG